MEERIQCAQLTDILEVSISSLDTELTSSLHHSAVVNHKPRRHGGLQFRIFPSSVAGFWTVPDC